MLINLLVLSWLNLNFFYVRVVCTFKRGLGKKEGGVVFEEGRGGGGGGEGGNDTLMHTMPSY